MLRARGSLRNRQRGKLFCLTQRRGDAEREPSKRFQRLRHPKLFIGKRVAAGDGHFLSVNQHGSARFAGIKKGEQLGVLLRWEITEC